MLEVDALQTKEIKVEISNWTVRNIILSHMQEILNIPENAYIKDEKVMVDICRGGSSHSWYDEEVVRDATHDDYAAVLIIEKMKKEL